MIERRGIGWEGNDEVIRVRNGGQGEIEDVQLYYIPGRRKGSMMASL